MIERLNNEIDADIFIGLGDIECPQYIRNFYGIVGEMEDVSVLKYLKRNNKYVTKLLNISSDFSTDVVITHYPPKGSITGIINGVLIGSNQIMAKILSTKPKLLFHAHSDIQKEYLLGQTRIVSIGNLNDGYYTEYYPDSYSFMFKKLEI
ncbi:MAG: hypothetical protein QW214_00705 [Saccharolobus sp.]